MVNLETIIITEANFSEIPDNAFRPLNGPQNSLNLIDFYNFPLSKIGINAFQDLNNLTTLIFEMLQINNIRDNTFNFINESNSLLNLQIHINQLNSSSFEKSSFSNLKRPVYLDLGSNQIDFLDEHIFGSLLNENKLNQLDINSLNCDDCRNFWLINNHYSDFQLDHIYCNNTRKVTDKLNFAKCATF
jgi:hypothetical protein